MKKIFLSVLIATVFGGATQAQEIRDRESGRQRTIKREHRGGHELKSLNLSEDQKTKFKALQEQNRKEMAEIRKNENITVKEWKAKMEAQRKDYRSKVQGLLTEDQKAQLEKSKAERRSRMSDRTMERTKLRSDRMKTELGLSEEQAAKMKSNREAMTQKMKTIRENKSLTDEAKKEQVQELMKQQKEEMKSILTEEQLKKMQDQRKHRTHRKKVV